MAGDNFNVTIHSEGKKHFESAVRMIFDAHGRVTHYLRGGLPKRKCLACCNGKKSFWEGEGNFKSRTEIRVTCSECRGELLPAQEAMILYWGKDERVDFDIQPLPFALMADAAVDFLWAWLQSCSYQVQPDHDGDNGKGYCVTSGDFWGHCEGSYYSVIAVYPEWQMYGK